MIGNPLGWQLDKYETIFPSRLMEWLDIMTFIISSDTETVVRVNYLLCWTCTDAILV